MFSMNNDKDRLRFILIGMLCTGFVCVVIALCMQLSRSAAVEEVAVDELLQQYWQEQTLHSVDSAGAAETPALTAAESVESYEAGHQQGGGGNDTIDAQNAKQQEISNDEVAAQAAATEAGSEEALKAADQTAAEAAIHDGKIDINRATAEQLQQLKGIGPSKAKAIVDDREQKGSFKSIADIKRVKGIGEKLYAGIQESIVANP